MKKIIVGFVLFIILTAALASSPVSALNLDKKSDSLNPIERRLENIKKTLEEVNINSIIDDDIPEQRCIILYYLLGILSTIGFFIGLAIDLLILFIIAILSGG